jgi:phage regulator Rha-like protein
LTREVTEVPPVIERRIYLIRNQKVILSTHLAELYGVEPRALIQAIKRNASRFPADFMFQLTKAEFDALRSQIVILEKGRGRYPKYPPFAFTEQGVAMVSSVLNSERAIQVNIAIMRAFVRLRELLTLHKDLARRIEALEKKDADHDANIRVLFQSIREYLEAAQKKGRRIGF